jgi:hypothetical protein
MKSTIKLWEKLDLRFKAEQTYDNPYTDLTVWVDLEGPDFKSRCYGFWDGYNDYVVRVTATAPGNWSWRSGSSSGDKGLSGKSGNFEATEWSDSEKAANACRRGFIRATESGHAFQYADGTPYFLLGDTWWATGSFRFPWAKFSDRKGHSFEEYVELRKKQGYNCVAIIAALPNWVEDGKPARLDTEDGLALRAAWGQADSELAKAMHDEEGNTAFHFPGKASGYGDSFPDLDRINPAYFRNLDKKIDYLNEHGFTPFIEPTRRDIGRAWKAYHEWPQSYVRYIQYVWARYQANNCLLSPIHYDTGAVSVSAPDWNEAANRMLEQFGPPPFGTPVGCNPHGNSLLDFGHIDEARWLSFHQSGNGRRDHYTYSQLTDIFNTNPPVPAINGEPQYEGMVTLTSKYGEDWYFGDVRLTPSPSDDGARYIRSAAYGSVLSGGLGGHIYGAGGWDGGLWRGDVEEASPVKMWECMKWPGGAQMQHLAAFMLSEGSRYWDVEPRPELLTPNRQGPVASYDGWSYCAATAARDLVFVYQEQDTPETSLRRLKPNAQYNAQWFDPRSGQWKGETAVKADDKGKLILPPKPSSSDWALKLKAK